MKRISARKRQILSYLESPESRFKSQKEIATDLGIRDSTLSEHLKALDELGLLPPEIAESRARRYGPFMDIQYLFDSNSGLVVPFSLPEKFGVQALQFQHRTVAVFSPDSKEILVFLKPPCVISNGVTALVNMKDMRPPTLTLGKLTDSLEGYTATRLDGVELHGHLELVGILHMVIKLVDVDAREHLTPPPIEPAPPTTRRSS